MTHIFRFLSVTALIGCSMLSFSQVAPRSNHVVIVVEENHSYDSALGGSMPFLTSLAQRYGLATQYYADAHPSIGNYFLMTTGNFVTSDDSFGEVVGLDNIVRQMLGAGKTWKSYAEGIPDIGYTGGDWGAYVKRHNPFAYLSDVANSSQRFNIVGIPELMVDTNNNSLPNLSFISPNIYDDGHDGSLANADWWLEQHIAPILKLPEFQPGGDGLLVITFDESFDWDTIGGGGHVATVLVGPRVKPGYRSDHWYQHVDLLRLIEQSFGLAYLGYAGTTAHDMGEFFVAGGSTPLPGPPVSPFVNVTVLSPGTDVTLSSPVMIQATATGDQQVTGWYIYDDGQAVWNTPGPTSRINTLVNLSRGKHTVLVRAWENGGAFGDGYLTITVP